MVDTVGDAAMAEKRTLALILKKLIDTINEHTNPFEYRHTDCH